MCYALYKNVSLLLLLIFVEHIYQNCLHPSFVTVHNAVRMRELLLCCERSRKCHHAAQTKPTWTKTILTCFTKLIAVQPSMAECE